VSFSYPFKIIVCLCEEADARFTREKLRSNCTGQSRQSAVSVGEKGADIEA
jgi:hypothetical protein